MSKVQIAMVTLQPVIMRKPSGEHIYAPSLIRPQKVMPLKDFETNYTGVDMLISFDPDGLSHPVKTKAYSKGLDCWYIPVDLIDDERN